MTEKITRTRRRPATTRALSGPHGYYRPKEGRITTLTMSQLGNQILDAAQARTGRSKGDIFERLLREHASDLAFEDAVA